MSAALIFDRGAPNCPGVIADLVTHPHSVAYFVFQEVGAVGMNRKPLSILDRFDFDQPLFVS
jgi:hypothetical protein